MRGFAGLRATARPGERRLCSFYVSGGRLLAWFHCVGNSFDFHLGQDVYCVVAAVVFSTWTTFLL